MQKMYPKLITVLFVVLLVAMILKYSDVGSASSNLISKTAQLSDKDK